MLYSTTFRKKIKKKEKATVAVLRASILDREIHLFVFIPHKVTSIKKKPSHEEKNGHHCEEFVGKTYSYWGVNVLL